MGYWKELKKRVLQLTFKSDDDSKCAVLYVDYHRVSYPQLKKMTIIQVRLAWKLLVVYMAQRPKTRKIKDHTNPGHLSKGMERTSQ